MTALAESLTELGAPYDWQAIAPGANLLAVAGFACKARLEPHGVLRMKGALELPAGKEIAAGQPVLTLPAALRIGTRKLGALIGAQNVETGTQNAVSIMADMTSGVLSFSATLGPAPTLLFFETSWALNPE